MSLINIEKVIENPYVGNKFKLNRILSLRTREIIDGGDGVLPSQSDITRKPTTQAILEILENKIKIEEIKESE